MKTARQIRDTPTSRIASAAQGYVELRGRGRPLDGDGEIDLREWELARSQARREVTQLQREILAAPEAHVVRKPASNRLYLISDLDPDALARRYGLWSAFHLTVFFGAAAAAAWLHGSGSLLR